MTSIPGAFQVTGPAYTISHLENFSYVLRLIAMGVELPIDHLRDLWPEKFHGARVGALLHPASVSANLEHTSNVLEQHNGDLFRLAAFFRPQLGAHADPQDHSRQ